MACCRLSDDSPGPVMVAITSWKPPVANGTRTVIVAPCRMAPTVLPVQVTVRGGVGGRALHATLSTPLVVGMNTRGMPPGAAAGGPVAAKLKAKPPPPRWVAVPVTAPVTVHGLLVWVV